MAEFIINNHDLEGDMVECGVFKGGSTAKLSILAKEYNKKYHIYDSFEGLSKPKEGEEIDTTLTGKSQEWKEGEFKGALEEVKSNIETYGAKCDAVYHKGYFEETMPKYVPEKIFFAFVDCDLVEPAQTCVEYLWPRIVPGGRLFFHDVNFRKFCVGICDTQLWEKLGEKPPILWGAGYGCSDMAENVGFFEKEK